MILKNATVQFTDGVFKEYDSVRESELDGFVKCKTTFQSQKKISHVNLSEVKEITGEHPSLESVFEKVKFTTTINGNKKLE